MKFMVVLMLVAAPVFADEPTVTCFEHGARQGERELFNGVEVGPNKQGDLVGFARDNYHSAQLKCARISNTTITCKGSWFEREDDVSVTVEELVPGRQVVAMTRPKSAGNSLVVMRCKIK